MIEIICQGKSPCEAKTKCMMTEMLLSEKNIPTDIGINILNAIGGISIADVEPLESESYSKN